jgi:hypothetical protein
MASGRHTLMDEPTPTLDPPDIRRCAICGEPWASYGFAPPGSPPQAAEAWYCATHREGGRSALVGALRAARHAAGPDVTAVSVA